jgi:DNA-binding transcriptional LysR family regulator
MNWSSVTFDWNQARAFLVTAEEGSLSAASRALGLTQPTLGRQVAALEEALGVLLFDRVGRSLVLSPAGLDLLDHARGMGTAAASMSMAASGQSQAIEGQVSISASDATAAYLLPPLLADLAKAAPGIRVDVISANEVSDLTRREADIAIRHVRSEQPDLIARHIGDTTAHIYGATVLLDRLGRPETVDDLARFPFILFDRPERAVSVLADSGIPVNASQCQQVSTSGVVIWEMVKQGLGLSVMTRDVAFVSSQVEQVLPGLPDIPVPVWLVTHRELRTSRRIRLVFDFLAVALSRQLGVTRSR